MLNPFRALRGFLNRPELDAKPTKKTRYSSLRLESLEHRRVLANLSALPGILGTVFADANLNGTADTGEAIAGATVQLFQDDGDGIFDANTDTQFGTDATTDASGEYFFESLDAEENFFVVQPDQIVNGRAITRQVSQLLECVPDLLIDDFITTQSTVAVPPPVSNDNSALSFANENEVLGAERDLAVELSSGFSEVQLRVNPFGLDDVLLFDSSAGTTGERVITWDGVDNAGDTLSMGLGGRDLTVGDTLGGIVLRMGVDANGANGRLRLYQGTAANFSEVTFPIPVTGGTATETVFVPFTSFGGAVNANNVDAIQLFLDTGNSSVDGQIDTIGVLGPKVANFANAVQIDLELAKQVNASVVDNGDQVTWTLTLTNNNTTANTDATGAVVTDALPAGVTFVSANTTSGAYSSSTNEWTLGGPLAPGDVETLTIVSTVNSTAAGGTVITNVAQVSEHDQTDVDSSPNDDDGDQSGDDEDNAQITLASVIDVELTKEANSTTAAEGDQVTFTITAFNNPAGANAAATGVQIQDALPAGLTLVSGTPSGNGQFDNGTGVWSLIDPLATGDSETLTILASVDAGIQGNTQLSNVAEVTVANETDVDSIPGNDDGDQSEDDEDSAVILVGAVVDLELTKNVNATTVDANDNLVWTVTVLNNADNANTAATNVVITDVLPSNVTLVNSAPSGNGLFDTGTGVWTLVDALQPGSTATLTLTTSVNGDVGGGDKIINTAQISSLDQADFDSTPGNDDGDQSEDDEAMVMALVNPQIDLELTKTVDSATANTGDQVTWTVTVSNNATNANTDATGVQVTDVLPPGVTLVSNTPSSGSFNGGIWTLGGALAPGASESLILVTTVDVSNSGSDILVNRAQVSAANEPDIDSVVNNDDGDQSEDDEDNSSITVNAIIDLELEKTVSSATVAVGDQVTWTVTVSNNATNANASATGVEISDAVPSGLTINSTNPSNGAFTAGVWTLANPLAPGDSATLEIVTTVDTLSTTEITNIAQVSAANETDFDSQPNNDTGDQSQDDEDNALLQLTPQIDLELTKTVDRTTVNIGDQVTWTIVVTNNASNANADATGVTVTDVVPTGTTLVSTTESVGSFAGDTWTLGTLAPGAIATLTVATTVDASVTGDDVLVNTAEVASANETDIDSAPANDDGDQSEDEEDNAQVTVNSVVDLDVEKSVSQSDVSVGDDVTWTILVTNDSSTATTSATGVEVTDALPSGVTFVSASTANGAYDSGTGIWSLGSALAPGETATLTIVSTVNATATGSSLLNVAEITGHNEQDIDSQPDNDDGDQSQDDEDGEPLNVASERPLSKRALFASAQ